MESIGYSVADVVAAAQPVLGGVLFSVAVVVGMKIVFWVLNMLVAEFSKRWW
jgi:hypothetical protein